MGIGDYIYIAVMLGINYVIPIAAFVIIVIVAIVRTTKRRGWKDVGAAVLECVPFVLTLSGAFACFYAMCYGFADFMFMNFDVHWDTAQKISLGVGIVVCFILYCEFRKGRSNTAELKEELGKVKKELESETSSKEWANEAYDRLLEDYYEVLERHNIPVNWKSSEEEEYEADEDDGDDLVEIVVKGKDGTRIEKVPAVNISFKGRN